MKITLLFVFTLCIFLVETWLGLAAFVAMTLAAVGVSHVGWRRCFAPLVSVYVIMAFTVLFNAVSFVDAASDALFALGPFAVSGSGFERGCFFAIRILLLCVGSMVVTYTTTSTQITDAFGSMLHPLHALHVPVDDITTTLSLALRFIPLLAVETQQVRDARWARGAKFDGSIVEKLTAWGSVFLPLFVGLFRRADRLAFAMDARCYGLPGTMRTSLSAARIDAKNAFVLFAGLVLFVVLAIFL